MRLGQFDFSSCSNLLKCVCAEQLHTSESAMITYLVLNYLALNAQYKVTYAPEFNHDYDTLF